jgi:hypothetical protein
VRLTHKPEAHMNMVHNKFKSHHPGPVAFAVDFRVPAFVGTDLFPFPLTCLSNGWLVAVATIGPDLAAAMLALNAPYQRDKKPHAIERYVSDMASGHWLLTHQGIAFNVNGELFDGQNRLASVVEAGTAQEFLVFFGAGDREEMAKFDSGKIRLVQDAAKVLGLEVNKNDFATIRAAAMESQGNLNLSNTDLITLARHHLEGLRWVDQHLKCAVRLKPSGVRAGILRAFYYCDRDELARFCGIYLLDLTPGTRPGDRAPILLNKFVSGSSGGDQPQRVTYARQVATQFEMRAKTMRAVQAFFGDEALAKLQIGSAMANLFPLPDSAGPAGEAA